MVVVAPVQVVVAGERAEARTSYPQRSSYRSGTRHLSLRSVWALGNVCCGLSESWFSKLFPLYRMITISAGNWGYKLEFQRNWRPLCMFFLGGTAASGRRRAYPSRGRKLEDEFLS
jgi:hypothetical protein